MAAAFAKNPKKTEGAMETKEEKKKGTNGCCATMRALKGDEGKEGGCVTDY